LLSNCIIIAAKLNIRSNASDLVHGLEFRLSLNEAKSPSQYPDQEIRIHRIFALFS